jgi:hypothetical protein
VVRGRAGIFPRRNRAGRGYLLAKTRDAGFHTHLTKPLVISQLEYAILKGPWAKSVNGKE